MSYMRDSNGQRLDSIAVQDGQHTPGLVVEHSVMLGDYTATGTPSAPTPTNAKYVGGGLTTYLNARVGTTCEVVRCNLLLGTAVAADATNYWEFDLRRMRPNGQPDYPTSTAAVTTTIVSAFTVPQTNGGHAFIAGVTYPLYWKTWDWNAAQLQEEDVLALFLQPHGAPPLLDRLTVTYALRELP